MSMNKYAIIVFVLIAIALSGCVSSDKTVYENKTLNETITLYKDNTMIISSPKDNLSGTYKIDGDKVITVFPPFGTTLIFTKTGNKLIYTDEKGNQAIFMEE